MATVEVKNEARRGVRGMIRCTTLSLRIAYSEKSLVVRCSFEILRRVSIQDVGETVGKLLHAHVIMYAELLS